MAGRRAIGKVERSYRAWVATLGELSPRQKATAEQVYALAEQLDKATDVPVSAVATVSRELRVAAAELRDVAALPAPAPAEKPRDGVDEVKARRERRRAEAAGDQ